VLEVNDWDWFLAAVRLTEMRAEQPQSAEQEREPMFAEELITVKDFCSDKIISHSSCQPRRNP